MGDAAKKSGKEKTKKKKAADDGGKAAEPAPPKEDHQQPVVEVTPATAESEPAAEAPAEAAPPADAAPASENAPAEDAPKESKPPEKDTDEWSKAAEEYTANFNVKKPEPKKGQALRSMDDKKLIELHEAFNFFDVNKDGIIDCNDLKNTFTMAGQPDMPEDQISAMLKEANNPLDFEGFAILLGCKTLDLDPEDILVHAFSMWDKKKTGLISEHRLRFDLMSFEDKFTEDEVEIALEEAPIFIKDNKPMIDYKKFARDLGGFRSDPKKN